MISVIIASADPQLRIQVQENIALTIGIPFEVLAIENTDGRKGICQIYNEGTIQAQYDILCYMHEDVALKTYGWGSVVKGMFERHPKLGVIGVAGGMYKSLTPTGWSSVGAPGSERTNILQSFKYIKHETLRPYINPKDEAWSRVVAVDGVWMCVRKEVAVKHSWDSETFKGFHCYDIDFCLSAGRDYDIAVTYEVLLHHFSEGKLDRNWMEATLLLYYKWENELPKSITAVSKSNIRKIEKRNFRFWVRQMHFLEFDKKIAYTLLHRPRIIEVLGWKYYLKFHYTILYIYQSKKKQPGGKLFLD